MKFLAPLALVALAACTGGPPAPANPNSVPNIQLSLTQARDLPGAIYVTGGIYDGAATGQTATFVVTPDDAVICTFQTDPVGPTDGTLSRVDANRLTITGAYSAVANAVLPNVAPPNATFTNNFTVESRSPTGVSRTETGFGDPRFDALITYFMANPTPCWTFG